MEVKTYKVVREHLGDKLYSPQGPHNTRQAAPHEVKHLVDRGVLVEALPEETDPAPQPDPAPENKAEAAPETTVKAKAGKKVEG